MKKQILFLIAMLMFLPITSKAQAQNNKFVENAKIVQLDGKYKGTDARVTISLSESSNGGASISIDYSGKTIESLIISEWFNSTDKIFPLYVDEKICLIDDEHGVVIEYNEESQQLIYTSAHDEYNCEIEVSRVTFFENDNSQKLFSDKDKKKSFDYLKLYFKRAE